MRQLLHDSLKTGHGRWHWVARKGTGSGEGQGVCLRDLSVPPLCGPDAGGRLSTGLSNGKGRGTALWLLWAMVSRARCHSVRAMVLCQMGESAPWGPKGMGQSGGTHGGAAHPLAEAARRSQLIVTPNISAEDELRCFKILFFTKRKYEESSNPLKKKVLPMAKNIIHMSPRQN